MYGAMMHLIVTSARVYNKPRRVHLHNKPKKFTLLAKSDCDTCFLCNGGSSVTADSRI